jgi:hypothetical protein
LSIKSYIFIFLPFANFDFAIFGRRYYSGYIWHLQQYFAIAELLQVQGKFHRNIVEIPLKFFAEDGIIQHRPKGVRQKSPIAGAFCLGCVLTHPVPKPWALGDF